MKLGLGFGDISGSERARETTTKTGEEAIAAAAQEDNREVRATDFGPGRMSGKGGGGVAKLGSMAAAAAAPPPLSSSWSIWESLVRSVSNFRLKTKQQELLLRVSALVLIYILAFATRLFSVLRYESVIHEFDPYFNYRTTLYLTQKGFYEFWNWFDYETWYPLGRIIGGTLYPGLMVTAAFMYWTLRFFTFAVHIKDVCVLTAPFFASNTAIVAYFFGKELRDRGTGLVAAIFMAICPGYISRSVAGSYDNEGVAIFALVLTFYLFVKAVNTGSLAWSVASAFAYFYMVSAWGGYIFIINLIPIYVIVLLVTGRYSMRLYIAYNTLYILGMLLAMQIRFVGFQHVQSGEHMAALGVFFLMQVISNALNQTLNHLCFSCENPFLLLIEVVKSLVSSAIQAASKRQFEM